MANSIGSISFTRFLTDLPPFRPTKQFVTETKPGVDGFATIYTGRHGEPFDLQVENVFDTRVNAELAKIQWQDSPGLAFGTIVWEDVDIEAAQGVQFQIRAARVDSLRRVAFHQGPGWALYGAWVMTGTFTLVPRFTPS